MYLFVIMNSNWFETNIQLKGKKIKKNNPLLLGIAREWFTYSWWHWLAVYTKMAYFSNMLLQKEMLKTSLCIHFKWAVTESWHAPNKWKENCILKKLVKMCKWILNDDFNHCHSYGFARLTQHSQLHIILACLTHDSQASNVVPKILFIVKCSHILDSVTSSFIAFLHAYRLTKESMFVQK